MKCNQYQTYSILCQRCDIPNYIACSRKIPRKELNKIIKTNKGSDKNVNK